MTWCHILRSEGREVPKPTFFNLSEVKRQTLLEAALNEFSRASLADASISNIIKEAGIPRGSFYQYFEGKEDLYFYILNVDTKYRREKFMLSLETHEGSFFKAIVDLFLLVLKEVEDEKTRMLYRNVFLNMDYKTEKTFINSIYSDEFDKQYKEIKNLINKENLNISSDEELFQMFQIVITQMMQNFVLKFSKDLTNEEATDNFLAQIQLLKKGFIKRD